MIGTIVHLLSGAMGVLEYTSPRPVIGGRATWPQRFNNADYHTARVSKVYHMGVQGGIEDGGDGADEPASWPGMSQFIAAAWTATNILPP